MTEKHTLKLNMWDLAVPDEWAHGEASYGVTEANVVGPEGSEEVHIQIERKAKP